MKVALKGLMMTRKVGFGILVLVAVVSLTSCQSIQLQSNYIEDDLYYSDPSHHNINPNTIGLNDQVAVPDSALVYFDESYAASLRPDYQRRLGIGGDDPVSFEADTSDYYNPNEDNTWRQNGRTGSTIIAVGTGVGVGSWNMANGNTGYYPISYGPYSPRQTYYPNTRTSGFAPQVSSASDPDPVRPIVYRPPSRTENYRPNPNPGYTFPSSNNRYQTRGSTHENYTPPGYHNSTRGGATNYGGSNPSTPRPTVSGVRRR